MRTFVVALLAGLLSQAGAVQAETLYFIHVDHLGTPRLAIGEDGVERWRWDQLEPFGDNVPIETMGTEGYLINLPLRFPGQYADKETGLAYNMARDYASDTGRYIQSDPIGLTGGINTYAYVRADPLSLIDPSGKLSYNKPPPDTVPVSPDMETKVRCIEGCLGIQLVITGGAEQSGHKCAKSQHYSGDAVDFGFNSNPNISGLGKNFFCCAEGCGFPYGQTESKPAHYHLQTIPGCGVPKLPSCKQCP